MQRLSRFRDSTSQNSRTTHALIIFIFFSKNGPLIGKNSQLRSRSLDSLAARACKFSSHSSEHRRRSYELCILAQIGMHGMQNNHVIPLSHGSRGARCRSSQLLSAYCARVSPERRAGTLQKWLYSLGCPQALGGKGPTRTIASRAYGPWPLPQETAGRWLLIRSRWSFWVRHSFNCCLAPCFCSEAGNSMHQSRFREELHV